MIVCFEELTNCSDGFRLDFDQLPASVGRVNEATVHLTNILVSRQHCEIDVIDGYLVVRDLGALNGTLVNDQLIREARLSVGDTLQIGLQRFRVRQINTAMVQGCPTDYAESSLVGV